MIQTLIALAILFGLELAWIYNCDQPPIRETEGETK
jgi:hypothetical protein